MREIYGRILSGITLGCIATLCFLNKYLTCVMVALRITRT